MKNRFIKYFLVALMIVVPNIVDAASSSVQNVYISGQQSIKVGSEVTIDFVVAFKDIESTNKSGTGLMGLISEVDYDPKVLVITDISTPSFDSSLTLDKENNIYYIESIVNGETGRTLCSDNAMVCDSYVASVTFYVRETDVTFTTVKIGDIVGVVADVKEDGDYQEDDASLVTYTSTKSHPLTIESTSDEVLDKAGVEVNEEANPQLKFESSVNFSSDNEDKSSNNYLKSLKIDGYEIDFDKEKSEYQLTIPDDVLELEIEASVEDSRASYKTNGNELLEDGDEIRIIVTAEDRTKKTYTIKITKENGSNSLVSGADTSSSGFSLSDIKIEKKHVRIASLGLGCLVGLFVIVKIIGLIKDRKINKALDEL